MMKQFRFEHVLILGIAIGMLVGAVALGNSIFRDPEQHSEFGPPTKFGVHSAGDGFNVFYQNNYYATDVIVVVKKDKYPKDWNDGMRLTQVSEHAAILNTVSAIWREDPRGRYYFRAWSWSEKYGYSLDYAEASVVWKPILK